MVTTRKLKAGRLQLMNLAVRLLLCHFCANTQTGLFSEPSNPEVWRYRCSGTHSVWPDVLRCKIAVEISREQLVTQDFHCGVSLLPPPFVSLGVRGLALSRKAFPHRGLILGLSVVS